MVIHGGFWKAAYDLSLGRPLAASLAEHGWAAWNIEYRRVGNGGGDPATLDDVAAADRRARRPGRCRSTGSSRSATPPAATSRPGPRPAGGSTRWPAKVELTGVVSQAGVLDLWSAYDEGLGGGAVAGFLGHPPGPGRRSRVDPLHQVPLDVPVHCVHGIARRRRPDQPVAATTSRAAPEAGARRGAAPRSTGDHFVVIDPTTEAWRQTLAILDGL